MYRPGNYVYPTDLPRQLLCRVVAADTRPTTTGTFQILELMPLEGPWRSGTHLVRLDNAVVPTAPRALWRRASAPGRAEGRDAAEVWRHAG